MTGAEPDFVASTYIRCTRDALWDALTTADAVTRYHFAGIAARGDLAAAGDVQVHRAGGSAVLTQTVVEAVPGERLVVDFRPGWGEAPRTTRVAFRIETQDERVQRLTIEHYGTGSDRVELADGWARFASNLKSWLETGEPVVGRMDGAV